MKNHELFTHRLHDLRNDIVEQIEHQLEKIGAVQNETIFLTNPIGHKRTGENIDYIDRIQDKMVLITDFENFSYPLMFNFLKPSVLINLLEELEEKRFFIQP
jgi:hypothetical protein